MSSFKTCQLSRTKCCVIPSPRLSIAQCSSSLLASWFHLISMWTKLCWAPVWVVMIFINQMGHGEDTRTLGVSLQALTMTWWLRPWPVSRSCRKRLRLWRKPTGTTNRGQQTLPSHAHSPPDLCHHGPLCRSSLFSGNKHLIVLRLICPTTQKWHTNCPPLKMHKLHCRFLIRLGALSHLQSHGWRS